MCSMKLFRRDKDEIRQARKHTIGNRYITNDNLIYNILNFCMI